MEKLFVYGTLIFPEIHSGLTGKTFKTKNAVLPGFKRCKVPGCDYPAIVRRKNAQVEGILLEGVDKSSMNILTFFEGEDYIKEVAHVVAEGQKIRASVFVWANKYTFLDDCDWNLAEFETNSLKFYAEKIIPETVFEFNLITKTESGMT